MPATPAPTPAVAPAPPAAPEPAPRGARSAASLGAELFGSSGGSAGRAAGLAGARAVGRRSLGAPAWFLLAAVPAGVLHAVAAARAVTEPLGARAADLAAAAADLARASGRAVDLGFLDSVAAHQLALAAPLTGSPDGTVLGPARAACLAAGLLGALLLWPTARALGARPSAAAAAVAVAGLPTVLVALRGAIDAGALGALWLAAAAALVTGPVRGLRLLAVAAGALAVLTTPLAAVGPLVLVAHPALLGAGSAASRRGRAVLLLAGAAVVAVLGTGDRALAAAGGAPVPGALPLAAVGVALAVAAAVWLRVKWARPVVFAALAATAVVLVPGPARSTALLLAAPAVALLVALLLERTAERAAWPAAAVGSAVALAVAVPAVAVAARPAPAAPEQGALSGWVDAHLDAGTPLVVDDLTRAELERDGVSPDRLLSADDSSLPAPGVAVVADRPGAPARDRLRAASVPLAGFRSGADGAAVEVRELVGDPAAVLAERAEERAAVAAFGAQVAENPTLVLPADARELLAAGDVDARLVVLLGGLLSVHAVDVVEFPAVPGEPADVPRRSVVVSAVDGRPVDAAGSTRLVEQWLDGQQEPFRPDRSRDPAGRLVLSFPAPAPLGLLGR